MPCYNGSALTHMPLIGIKNPLRNACAKAEGPLEMGVLALTPTGLFYIKPPKTVYSRI